MLRLFTLLIFAWTFSPAAFRASLQQEPTGEPPIMVIRSPVAGQALQGSVPIVVELPADSVQAIEASFAYAGDERETWFLIDQISEPDESGELAAWDTTTLTDGVYTLQLSIEMENGDRQIIQVAGLRVRNYTPVETNTPAPPAQAEPEETIEGPSASQEPASLLTATIWATPEPLAGLGGSAGTSSPEPLPTNPAQISNQAVMASLGKGALAAALGFLLLAIYRAVQQLVQNRSDSA
jgi:hypothetical protein